VSRAEPDLLRLPYRPDLPVATSRLELRFFRADDTDRLLAFQSLPDVVRYVPYEPRTPDTMAAAMDRKLAGTALRTAGDHLDIAVVLRDGTLIGDLVVMPHALEHASVEVGWIFDPAYGGRGLATEAVTALLDLVFVGLRAHRAAARVDARNASSLALCARLGMRPEAHLVDNEWFKGEWSNEIDYALLAHEWPHPVATA